MTHRAAEGSWAQRCAVLPGLCFHKGSQNPLLPRYYLGTRRDCDYETPEGGDVCPPIGRLTDTDQTPPLPRCHLGTRRDCDYEMLKEGVSVHLLGDLKTLNEQALQTRLFLPVGATMD